MAIDWSCLDRPANPASQHAEGEVIKRLEEQASAQSDANQRQLQEAKAEEAKRRRAEERQAAAYIEREIAKKGA